MALLENIKIAFLSIAANKMRSLLTMLGIIIGISAVITITTIGSSIEATLKNTINDLGGANYFTMSIETKPDISDEDLESGIPEMTDDDKISDSMIEELQDKYPGCYKTVRNEFLGVADTLNYNNYEMHVMVVGCSDGYLAANKIKFLAGRDISASDMKNESNVCTVSDVFVKHYFKKGENPLRKTIHVSVKGGEDLDLTIIGVYEDSVMMSGFKDPSEKEIDRTTYVTIPINTVYKLEGKEEQFHEYFSIEWNTDMDKELAKKQLEDYIEDHYRNNKYYHATISDESELLDTFSMVINVVTIAITFISAISLLVGGVGVMNIMLVSVTERTREIGIRKAIGAPNTAIRQQFVIESMILCAIGGIIGIIIGITNGVLIGQAAIIIMHNLAPDYESLISLSIQPSIPAMVLSVIFSMMTGIFFGYYPANKAAKMNTIDALRYE